MNRYSTSACLSLDLDHDKDDRPWSPCPFPSNLSSRLLLACSHFFPHFRVCFHHPSALRSLKHPFYLQCKSKCVSITCKALYIVVLTCSATALSCIYVHSVHLSVASCSSEMFSQFTLFPLPRDPFPAAQMSHITLTHEGSDVTPAPIHSEFPPLTLPHHRWNELLLFPLILLYM